MLDAQLKTARALERLLKRKPYLELSSDISAQEWCMLRLGTDPEQRLRSMRAITDQVYDKLESDFIKSRVYDLKDGQCGMSVRAVGSALSFDFIQSMVTDTIDYDTMQTWMWSLMCHQVYTQNVPKFTSTSETLESPEDNIAYIRADTTIVVKGAKTHFEGRWVVRMYVEANRTVFITQSIMDDALYPHAPDRKRDRSTCWAVLERHPTDPTKTRQYYLLQCVPGLHIESPDKGNTELMLYQGEMTEILLNVMRNCMESLKVASLRD
ncbi:unnamed protein product [Aphanomyces euteiches]|uniref:START domain-containing protein n=1 Tax=Aphanomyces euteiches TaxID=100861 RepID=A0A6G0WAF1_9STRA|nr:hypothetical protein Ae201684_017348 [Aphanomyces euteiches]